MFEGRTLLVYLATVALVGLAILLRVLLGLARTAQWRRRAIRERRRFEAIPTSTPLEDPTTAAKARALESVDRQFTVTRKALIPLILGTTVFALGLPFLDKVPGTLVSIVAAILTVLGGIATRPLLENAIAGLVISSSRLLNIGDTIKLDDFYGTVEDITTTHTTVKLWDWRRFVVPNSEMLQRAFLSYSLVDRFIWAKVEFWVDYEADLDMVEQLAIEAARASPCFAHHEEPSFWVMKMDKSGIQCWIAAWTNTPSDAWLLAAHVRNDLSRALRASGFVTHRHHVGVRSEAPPDDEPTP